jgi:hypothetical protein
MRLLFVEGKCGYPEGACPASNAEVDAMAPAEAAAIPRSMSRLFNSNPITSPSLF